MSKESKGNEKKTVSHLQADKEEKLLTSQHRDLIMKRNLGPQERVDPLRYRAFAPPFYERVEQEPVTNRGYNFGLSGAHCAFQGRENVGDDTTRG